MGPSAESHTPYPRVRVDDQRGQGIDGWPGRRTKVSKGVGGVRPNQRRIVLQLLDEGLEDFKRGLAPLAQRVDGLEADLLVARLQILKQFGNVRAGQGRSYRQ